MLTAYSERAVSVLRAALVGAVLGVGLWFTGLYLYVRTERNHR